MSSTNVEKNLPAAINYGIYWLDLNAKDDVHLQSQLNQLADNQLTVFDNPIDCSERIQSLANGKRVILVISDQFGRELVPTVDDLPQVIAIFVYCPNRDSHLQWAKRYKKASFYASAKT